MKHWGFLIAGLACLVLALVKFLRPALPEGAISEPPPPVSEPVKVPVKMPDRPAAKPKSVSVKPSPKDQNAPEVVPFEMKEGYAVAHGDIILGVPEDPSVLEGHYKMPSPNYWEKSEIPYVINNDVVNPDRIMTALRHIESKTGVHFVPYDDQPDAILFQAGREHCLSALGRQGGLQPIKLSTGCGWKEITHEVLHALGFIHEQSRSDRDQAVEVLWENIDEKYHPQFAILPDNFLGPARNTMFDYSSIMLYAPGTFAKEKGYQTMKSRSQAAIAPSQGGLSPGDIERVRSLFGLN